MGSAFICPIFAPNVLVLSMGATCSKLKQENALKNKNPTKFFRLCGVF